MSNKNNLYKYIKSKSVDSKFSFLIGNFKESELNSLNFQSKDCLMELSVVTDTYTFKIRKENFLLHEDFKDIHEDQASWWLTFIKNTFCKGFNAEVLKEASDKSYLYIRIPADNKLRGKQRFANYELIRYLAGHYNNCIPALCYELSKNYSELFKDNIELIGFAAFLNKLNQYSLNNPGVNYEVLPGLNVSFERKYDVGTTTYSYFYFPFILPSNEFKSSSGVQTNFYDSSFYKEQLRCFNIKIPNHSRYQLTTDLNRMFVSLSNYDFSDDLNVRKAFHFYYSMLTKDISLEELIKEVNNLTKPEVVEQVEKPLEKVKRKYVKKTI